MANNPPASGLLMDRAIRREIKAYYLKEPRPVHVYGRQPTNFENSKSEIASVDLTIEGVSDETLGLLRDYTRRPYIVVRFVSDNPDKELSIGDHPIHKFPITDYHSGDRYTAVHFVTLPNSVITLDRAGRFQKAEPDAADQSGAVVYSLESLTLKYVTVKLIALSDGKHYGYPINLHRKGDKVDVAKLYIPEGLIDLITVGSSRS